MEPGKFMNFSIFLPTFVSLGSASETSGLVTLYLSLLCFLLTFGSLGSASETSGLV